MSDGLRNFLGTMSAAFHIGGKGKAAITNLSTVLSSTAADESTLAPFAVAAPTDDTHAAPRLTVQRRTILIEFSFNGGGPVPSPGDNTGKYGFVHTSGGGYSAGNIYYDDGVSLSLVTILKMQFLVTTSVVTGTVSLITNGTYIAEASSAPWSWTLVGDGTATLTGIPQFVVLTIGHAGPYTSTTPIPTNAILISCSLDTRAGCGGVAYTAGSTVAVTCNAQSVMATTENECTATADRWETNPYLKITAGAVVTVTIGSAGAAGAGQVIVGYISTFLT